MRVPSEEAGAARYDDVHHSSEPLSRREYSWKPLSLACISRERTSAAIVRRLVVMKMRAEEPSDPFG